MLGASAQIWNCCRATALEILESLLRYYVQGTGRVEERDVRALLQQTSTGDPIMRTFIDRYIEQGRQEGGAALLLRQIERKFGAPSAAMRERISNADPETLLNWSERILTADSVDAVLHQARQVVAMLEGQFQRNQCRFQ